MSRERKAVNKPNTNAKTPIILLMTAPLQIDLQWRFPNYQLPFGVVVFSVLF